MSDAQLAGALWALSCFAFGCDVPLVGAAATTEGVRLEGLKLRDLGLLLNALVIKSQGRLARLAPQEVAMAAEACAAFGLKVRCSRCVSVQATLI